MEDNTTAVNPSLDTSEDSANREYYVNIDGEDIQVDVKSDEEYSCLINCLEGYYLYGGDSEEEEDDEVDDADIEDD